MKRSRQELLTLFQSIINYAIIKETRHFVLMIGIEDSKSLFTRISAPSWLFEPVENFQDVLFVSEIAYDRIEFILAEFRC